jgi:peptidyl-prolyl cis-trans isomerase SurA
VSPVLRSSNGFHLVKLLGKRGGGALQAVQQTHARHILIKVNEVVSEPEARHKLEGLRERIKHGENFADLARLFSQDGSASKGGDLGWIYAGDTVPEFERAMNQLAPGELSEPVQSPFGYHLIEVIERRVQDVSSDRQRGCGTAGATRAQARRGLSGLAAPDARPRLRGASPGGGMSAMSRAR